MHHTQNADPSDESEKRNSPIPQVRTGRHPIRRIWPDGIFQVEGRFSKTFSFTDINYSIAGKEDKTAMFPGLFGAAQFPGLQGQRKITINNRKVNKEEFENPCCCP